MQKFIKTMTTVTATSIIHLYILFSTRMREHVYFPSRSVREPWIPNHKQILTSSYNEAWHHQSIVPKYYTSKRAWGRHTCVCVYTHTHVHAKELKGEWTRNARRGMAYSIRTRRRKVQNIIRLGFFLTIIIIFIQVQNNIYIVTVFSLTLFFL